MLLRPRVHLQRGGQRLLLDQPEWLSGDDLWPLPRSAGEPYRLSVHHAQLLLHLLRRTHRRIAGPSVRLRGPRPHFSLLEYITTFLLRGILWGTESRLRDREWRSEKDYMGGDRLKGWLWSHVHATQVGYGPLTSLRTLLASTARAWRGPPRNGNPPLRRHSRKGCDWSVHWNPTQNHKGSRGCRVASTWDQNQPFSSCLIGSRSDIFPADLFLCRANHNRWSNMGRSWYNGCSEECIVGLRTKMAAADVLHAPLLWLVEVYPITSTGSLVGTRW